MALSFSLITVCYNAAACIEPTLASAAAQSWPHIDHVVVDGGSSDGTQAIVQRHAQRLGTFVSGPDKGIFDAMNKAIGLARGDVLFFLNADDRFCDAQVLADVAAAFEADPSLDLVYGNVIHVVGSGPGASLVKHGFHWVNARNIFFGDLCHQAVFARKRVFDRVGRFDLRYTTAADYDWLLRAFHSGVRARYLDRDICMFAEGGFHMQHHERNEAQRLEIKRKYHAPWRVWAGYWLLRVDLKLRKLRGQQIS